MKFYLALVMSAVLLSVSVVRAEDEDTDNAESTIAVAERPAEKIRTKSLRISVLTLGGFAELGGDIALSDSTSIGAYGQYWWLTTEIFGLRTMGAGMEIRYRPNSHNSQSGMYLSAHAGARNYNLSHGLLLDGAVLLGIIESAALPPVVSINAIGLGGTIGYQFVVSNSFLIEAGLGLTHWWYPESMNQSFLTAYEGATLSGAPALFPVLSLNVGAKL